MKELKCPKCGNVFTVDEADYASIVSQVKNAEFEEEVARRIKEMQGLQDAKQKAKDAEAREDFGKKLSAKEQELLAKEQEISALKASLEGIKEKTQLEIDKAVAAKNLEIAGLQNTIKLSESEKEKAVMIAKNEMNETLSRKNEEISALRSAKDLEIAELKSKNSLAQSQAELQKTAIKDEYEAKLKLAQEQVDYYKDMMAKTHAVDGLYTVFDCTDACKGIGVEKAEVFCTKENGSISLYQYCALNNLSRATASRELKAECHKSDSPIDSYGAASHKVWVLRKMEE